MSVSKSRALPCICKLLLNSVAFCSREKFPFHLGNDQRLLGVAASFGAYQIEFQISLPVAGRIGELLPTKVLEHGRRMVLEEFLFLLDRVGMPPAAVR